MIRFIRRVVYRAVEGETMAVSQACKNETLKMIQANLPRPGMFGIGRDLTVSFAKNRVNAEIRKIHRNDYSRNIVDFVQERYPQYYNQWSKAPKCLLKYSVGELIEFYNEVKDQF